MPATVEMYIELVRVCVQVERCYTGPQDAQIVEFMKTSNPRGPLVIHIAKLFPKRDCSSFDAFGRVFSGSVAPGAQVRPFCRCLGVDKS